MPQAKDNAEEQVVQQGQQHLKRKSLIKTLQQKL